MFEDAKYLITLSRNNPEFKSKYDSTITALDKITKEDPVNAEEARDFIEKLYSVSTGTVYDTLIDVYIYFTSEILQDRKDTNILESVSLANLLKARNIAFKYMQYVNKVFKTNVFKPNNKFLITYLRKVATDYMIANKNNDNVQWDKLEELNVMVITCLKKHLLYRENIEPVIKVLIYGYQQELKAFRLYDNASLNKMSLFSEEKDYDIIDEHEIVNNLKSKFLKNLDEFESYYKDIMNEVHSKFLAGEMKSVEYNYYNSLINSQYDFLLDDTPDKYYVVLNTFNCILTIGTSVNDLMMYTEDEIAKAFKFAYEFCEYYSNERIERIVLDFASLQRRYLKGTYGLTNRSTHDLIQHSLDLLLDYKIISSEKYKNYRERFK